MLQRFTCVFGLAIAAVVIANPITAQQPQNPTRFDAQIQRAAQLAPDRVSSEDTVDRYATHAKRDLIGAAIGAVLLPTVGYLVFHDRDSGRAQIGALLPVAAIGAFIGLMIGLHTGPQGTGSRT